MSEAQREAAVAALIVHREAGRLDSAQFEDRQVLAASARTWADLERLFADLPAPHPQRPQPPAAAAGSPTRSPGGWLETWSPKLVAATPILVLLLFFITKKWQVFLLVPLVMIFAQSDRGRNRRR